MKSSLRLFLEFGRQFPSLLAAEHFNETFQVAFMIAVPVTSSNVTSHLNDFSPSALEVIASNVYE